MSACKLPSSEGTVRLGNALGFGLCLLLATLCAHGANAQGLSAKDRIVFLGDSITDGETYILLVRQALVDAGRPLATLINAGVGGDDAARMRGRLDRDVLSQHPTRVFLSCGVNDRVPVEEFRASVSDIAQRLRERSISLTLMTPSIPGDAQPATEALRASYVGALHDIARQYHLDVAEVSATMHRARMRGEILIGEDSVHPNFAGSRLISRAVLDALGERDAAVPSVLTPTVMPGVIREWLVRPAPTGAHPLDATSIQTIAKDTSWVALTLPLPVRSKDWRHELNGQWWQEQERLRGFALGLTQLVGTGDAFQGISHRRERRARRVFFNTGAGLRTVWLNGVLVYRNTEPTGWHAGKERIPATLRAGDNTVVIEAQASFFLSVTDNNRW